MCARDATPTSPSAAVHQDYMTGRYWETHLVTDLRRELAGDRVERRILSQFCKLPGVPVRLSSPTELENP